MTDRLSREYEIGEEIGRGRFASVRRCKDRTSAEEFACKTTLKTRDLMSDSTDAECLQNEVEMMKHVAGHRGVVELRGAYVDEHAVHLVMDLCSGGDLFQRIVHRSSPFSEFEAAQLLKSLMEAVAHCHRLGVAHRDLKPDNILFPQANSPLSQMKIADFGQAARFSPRQRMSGVVGTPYYVAPEVLEGREYDERVDVWSAGVIVYVMLSGRPPFSGDSPEEIFRGVMRERLRFPANEWQSVSPSAKDLIRRMVSHHLPSRLSAQQVLRHPWVTAKVVND